MKRGVLLGVVIAALFAGTAQATTISPAAPYQRWLDESLVPTPEGHFEVFERDCPVNGYRACIYPWYRALFIQPPATKYVLYHEMGHAFDYFHLGEGERRHLLHLMGRPQWEWNWDEYAYGRPSARPIEAFAGLYAFCAKWRRWRLFDEYYFYPNVGPLSRKRTRRACSFIRTAI